VGPIPLDELPGPSRRRTLVWAFLWFLVGAAAVSGAGCAQNELGRYSGYYKPILRNPKRVRNLIVKSENYWIQKEVVPEEQFPGPKPEDLKASEADYILGPGDLIDVTVFELMAPGTPYVAHQRISQSGQMTFPYIGGVKAAGLTTRGLEEKLADMLEPDYIQSPQVSVFVSEYRNLNVAVLNGVYRPALYPMTKQDMSLLELVALSGGVLQLVEDYGYIIRKYSPDEADMLMFETGAAPPEGEAPAEGQAAPEAAKPEAGKPPAGAKPGQMPAPPTRPAAEPAPKAVEKAPKPAPKTGGAAPGTPKAEAQPAPAATPLEPSAARTPAGMAQEAQAILEKMAEGDMPPVKKIEDAEAAGPKTPAAAKPPAGPGAKPVPAAEKKPAATPDKVAAAPKPAAPAAETKTPEPAPSPVAKDGPWIWSDGKWVEVKEKGPAGTTPAAPVEPKMPEETRVAEAPQEVPEGDEARLQLEQKLRRLGVVQGAGQLRRIIRFDVRALQAGDPTQNVVLRDGDVVTIPSPEMGDFYMAGEVARPGVYSLTGRKITLLQAIAASGGVTAVAVPWRTEVIRRISETEEEIIYVDLSKVARGEVPDFYMQPEDLVRVGTDQGAIYNAVNRNAYRATYGWGAVYDMNFADYYPWRVDRHPLFGGLR
jgi:polysaccharide export outer membrane protein